MKRIFVFLLAFMLVFNLSAYSVHAESSSETAWYEDFWGKTVTISNDMIYANGTYIMSCARARVLIGTAGMRMISTYDAGATVVGAGMKYFFSLLSQNKTPSEVINTMGNSLTVNETTGNTSITGDGLQFIQNYYENGTENGTGKPLSDLSYCEMYVASAKYLNPANFSNVKFYNACKALITNNPDYYITITAYYGNYVRIFATNQAPLGGVLARSYWGNNKTSVSFYTDNWDQDFSVDSSGNKAMITIGCPDSWTTNPTYTYLNSEGTQVSLDESQILSLDIDNILVPDSTISQVDTAGWYSVENSCVFGSTYALVADYLGDGQQLGINMQGATPTLFHGASTVTAVPVFSTLNALKKGTIGLSTANVLPTYNGQSVVADSITDSQIQQADEIVNNYYSGTPSDDSPNGGSPNGDNDNNNNNNGGGSSAIWDTLANTIEHVFDVLAAVLNGLLSGIANILPTIGNLFTGLQDLANSGFTSLLSAFFPFLPTEWFSIIGGCIALVLLVWVVKVFKG